MNKVKCENGHFFDADIYSVCPVCNSEIKVEKPENTQENNKHKNSRWHFGKPFKKNEVKENKIEENQLEEYSEDDKTIGAYDTTDIPSAETGEEFDLPQYTADDNIFEEIEDSEYTDEMIEDIESTFDEKPEVLNSGNTGSVEKSLEKQIDEVANSRDGKTISYFNSMNSVKSEKNIYVDPVVGWIVCISGKHFGESFNLYSGNNSVGRNDNNRVAIKNDATISREKHTIIIFEPKKRKFYIQPGEGNGLTYLNEELVGTFTTISSGDIIEIGDSKFVFIPLCGENFTWDEYINRG